MASWLLVGFLVLSLSVADAVSISRLSGCEDSGAVTEGCPTAGGVILMLIGDGFLTAAGLSGTDTVAGAAADALNATVLVAGVRECPILAGNNTHMECDLPPGAGVAIGVTYTTNGGSAVSTGLSYAPPVVTNVTGCTNSDLDALPVEGTSSCNRTGGAVVTISGRDFGPDPPAVAIGGRTTTVLNASHAWVVARVPAGAGYYQQVTVTQRNGQASEPQSLVSYTACGVRLFNAFDAATDSYVCESCERGTYNDKNEAFACAACPPGSYCPRGSADPIACDQELSRATSPQGSWALVNCTCSSNLVEQNGSCGCASGSVLSGSAFCELCPAGTYQPDFQGESCRQCPDDRMTARIGARSLQECACPVGSTRNLTAHNERVTHNARCLDCPKGADCSEAFGSNLYAMQVLPGWWRAEADSRYVMECLGNKARRVCRGARWNATTVSQAAVPIQQLKSSGDALCKVGHGGALCRVCQKGYFWDRDRNGCEKCELSLVSGAGSILSIATFVVALLCFLQYAWTGEEAGNKMLMLKRFGPDVLAATRGAETGVAEETVAGAADEIVGAEMDKEAERHRRFAVWRARLRVLVAFYQIIRVFPWVLDIEFPLIFTSFLQIFSFLSFELFSVVPLGCVTRHWLLVQILAATLGPLLLLALLYFMFLVVLWTRSRRELSERRENEGNDESPRDFWERTTARYTNLATIVLFVVLPSTSATIFTAFQTDKVDGVEYLRSDFSLTADSAEASFIRIWCAFMVVMYPLGVPWLYARLLFARRRRLNPMLPDEKHERDRFHDHVHQQAEERFQQRGQLRMFRSSSGLEDRKSCCGQAFVQDAVRYLISKIASVSGDTIDNLVEFRKAELRASDGAFDIQSVIFLIGPYKPAYFWWEIVETMRRLLLVSFLVLVAHGEAVQVVVGIFVAIAGTKLYAANAPFLDSEVNAFAELAGWETQFVMLVALLLRVEADVASQEVWGGILIFATVIPPTIVFYTLLKENRKYISELCCLCSCRNDASVRPEVTRPGVDDPVHARRPAPRPPTPDPGDAALEYKL